LQVDQSAKADDHAGQAQERLVYVVADLPADAQSPKPVQEGEGLLDNPAVPAQAGTVVGAASGGDRRDTDRLDLRAVLVVVIGPIGGQGVWPSPRATAATRTGGRAWISLGLSREMT
jgi:hypothetical protein